MRNAQFSPCGKFRHVLWERWDVALPFAVWVLANPSIASVDVEDPTWRKGRGFSQRLGFGGQIFVNVFDYIATDPQDLARAGHPRSPAADSHIIQAAARGTGTVICAWGAVLRGSDEPMRIAHMLRTLGFATKALGFTSRGEPRHPLMLSYGTPLVSY